jgi:DNA-binding transcriptional MerR regulator
VKRLEFIRAGQAVGLTLRQLSQVLEIRDRGEAPCHHVTALVDERIVEVDQRIHDLQNLRRDLEALRQRAAGLDPAECPPESVCRVIHLND